MTVIITSDIAKMIEAKVEDGQYEDAEAVLREALSALDDRDQPRDLRASLARTKDQMARGEFVEWSPNLLDELSVRLTSCFGRDTSPKLMSARKTRLRFSEEARQDVRDIWPTPRNNGARSSAPFTGQRSIGHSHAFAIIPTLASRATTISLAHEDGLSNST